MQACLLLGVEPYLFRDDVKHALRAAFNAIAANYFADVRMITEHALPELGCWWGDHYKSSDEANAAGWLRYLILREQGDELLVGQAIPRDWQRPGCVVELDRAATYYGPTSVRYEADDEGITASIQGPSRNPPERVKVRFRPPTDRRIERVTVNGHLWDQRDSKWVYLPGNIGAAVVQAIFEPTA